MKYFLILLLSLVLCHCNTSLPNPPETQTHARLILPAQTLAIGTPDRQEQAFTPHMLTSSSDAFFFYDQQREKLVRIDKHQKTVSLFGGKGAGPGEFQKIDNLKYSNGMLFALDCDGFFMNVYDHDGVFLEQFWARANDDTRFCIDDGNRLYLSYPDHAKHPITVIDIGGEKVGGFGEWLTQRQNASVREYRHLVWSGEYLISVAEAFPMIELYTSDGELIRQKSFQEHPLIKERIQADNIFFDIHPQERENAFFRIFTDVSFNQGKLYASFSANPKNRVAGEIPPGFSSHIFVFDCGKRDVRLLEVLELSVEDRVYPYAIDSFTVDEKNELIAYDRNRKRLDIFQL